MTLPLPEVSAGRPLNRLKRLKRLLARALPALTAAALLPACAPVPVDPTMPTVAQVDVDRYLGSWFEIASLPNRFQAMCVADTEANYSRDGDDLKVVNRCRQADGSFTSATGVAKVVPGSGNAKLRVSFFRPFYGNYWVLALDPGYRWVLVGEPGREYGWLLSRTKLLPAADREAAMARAEALGYARSAFKTTPQNP